jgi:hypothetical protein
MSLTLAEKNSLLRDAVSERLDRKLHREELDVLRPVTPSYSRTSDEVSSRTATDDSYDPEKLDDAFAAFSRQLGDGITHQQPVTVAEQTLRGAIEAVRDRHTKYGPPVEHFSRTAALVNAAFGTTFTPADWALVMVLDKVARLRGPTPTTDGGIDIAGYGSCYEECRSCG